LAGLTRGFFRLQPVEPGVAVGVEPAGDGAAVNAEVSGNGLAWASAVGHEHDLESISQCAVGGGSEERVETFGLGGRQLNADRGGILQVES
jgi:hypothetical protein